MVKNKTTLRLPIFFVFVSAILSISAQSSSTAADYTALSAFEKFQQQQYQLVIGDLRNGSSRSNDEEILLMLSELKTGKNKSNRIERWIDSNSNHPIKPMATFHLGEYYFYQNDSLKAKEYLRLTSVTDLTKQDQANYSFIYGLIQLDDHNYSKAKGLFRIARKNGYSDEVKLNYYEAYTEYHLDNVKEALSKFQNSKGSQFESSANFFIAKILLDQGKVDQVIELGKNEISDKSSITNSGFYQIIGEAYALKDDVSKADAYFQKAIELHPGKPSAALYYQAGVAKFKVGNENKAIEHLTNSGIQGGEYAQLSAFQLGRLYLKKKDFENALSAYIEASVSKDPEIKEESIYHTTKINAELQNFSEAINYANDYIKMYRDGKWIEEMQNLIAQSYLRTSNYDLAIEHLNSVGVRNATQQSIYQKVTFQKAQLAFNDADFVVSKKWFEESLKYDLDTELSDKSYYHLAEIAMRNNQFEKAINLYKKQSKTDALAHYGLGYAYFNTQQYQSAIPHFRNAGIVNDSKVRLDAKVRLADCLFATKSYVEALSIYNQVSGNLSSPYLSYQKALTLKNLNKLEESLRIFNTIYRSDRYGADALFQSGLIHFEAARFAESESLFGQVITKFSNNPLAIESRLNRGISRKNLEKFEGSRDDYEFILKNHIQSDASLNAILGLQELQQAGIQIKNLEGYIADYKQAHPESGSLELIEFEAAKRLYFSFSYQQAANAFDKFLNDYPNSSSSIESKYYLGDSYYRLGQLEKARVSFEDLKYVRNTYTGRVLSRLGEINRALGNTKESKEAFLLLKDLNLTPKDNYNALQGLMQLYYQNQEYNKAIEAGNEILAADWKPLNGDQEAKLTKARSQQNLGNNEIAIELYEDLSESKDAYGAEASYQLGKYEFTNGNYDKSLDILFGLNEKYGSYTEWVDKSYLLIARNYLAKEEIFQAKATLRSIIQHSDNQAVVNESKVVLNQIEGKVAIQDSTKNED